MALPSELAEQVQHIAPTTLAREQLLSVPEVFHGILPSGGLQRGWTVRLEGSASARALAWGLLQEVTTSGRWVAAVNVAGISLAAAAELGVAIERVLVIQNVQPDQWSAALGALVGAVDVILFDSPRHRVRPSEQRKMASRCRERGTVLMELGAGPVGQNVRQARTGQLQYDVSFAVNPIAWEGLGSGYGHLTTRRVEVAVSGRRSSGCQRRGRFELPTPDGKLKCLDQEPSPIERPQLKVVNG